MAVRVRMQITALESGTKNFNVENVLMSAYAYSMIRDFEINIRSKKTKRAKEIF